MRFFTLHSSLFTFRTANKVQGERRAELARAMLSRSLYSLLQLVCESKVTKNLWRKYQLWYTYVHLWYTYDILTCTYVQLDALMRALSCLNGVETLQECQRSDARMTERKCKNVFRPSSLRTSREREGVRAKVRDYHRPQEYSRPLVPSLPRPLRVVNQA